jgi:hypothetical protein
MACPWGNILSPKSRLNPLRELGDRWIWNQELTRGLSSSRGFQTWPVWLVPSLQWGSWGFAGFGLGEFLSKFLSVWSLFAWVFGPFLACFSPSFVSSSRILTWGFLDSSVCQACDTGVTGVGASCAARLLSVTPKFHFLSLVKICLATMRSHLRNIRMLCSYRHLIIFIN